MKRIKVRNIIIFCVLLLIICIAITIAIDEYNYRISKIPKFEENIRLAFYIPFNENNRLAKLDEKSEFKLNENLPILDGATAFYPIYAAFVEAVYPSIKYGYFNDIAQCNKTANAYNNLLNGNVDLIFCLEPSEVQLQQFIDNNINLKFVPIGREAFVFFVNKNNPVENLTVEDIQEIYTGKLKNWNELNGTNSKILTYQRPASSGSQTILEKIMGSISIVEPLMEEVMIGMDNMIEQIAEYTNFNNAIGYSFLIYTTEMVGNNQIKLLSVNNIYPSIKTIQDNTYPFTVNIYGIYNDTEEKNENIEPFIKWILSRQGQTLISRTGYAPINVIK